MIRRIYLKNFMAHRETELFPSPGLTVITGDNNCGKSAVVLALQILANNANGDFMVRHGEDDCLVEVETDEGHVVQWRRYKGKTSYQIDGRLVERLRGDVPEDLATTLRLSAVEANGTQYDVHFAEQKRPVFLIDESPANRAAFFASSSDAAKLLQMQAVHKTQTAENRSAAQRLEQRIVKQEKRFQILSPLEGLREETKRLQQARSQLKSDLGRALRLRQLIDRLADVQSLTRHLQRRGQALKPLVPPPALRPEQPLARTIEKATAASRRQRQLKKIQDCLAILAPPPILVSVDPLRSGCRQIVKLERLVRRLQLRQSIFTQLPVPPAIENVGRLRGVINRLAQYSRAAERLWRLQAELQLLPDLPQYSNSGERVFRCLELLQNAMSKVDALSREKRKIEKEYRNVEAALARLFEELDQCPTCGQSIDPAKALKHAHLGVDRV